eukprot:TRINITY_DN103769_c0_g1_i1.p1 TRINITY_DN103769_c0_g1~~TRINITY_DN103769_c0_g1_i1.p1  ORF type:complete len:120 (+),score=21.72 TRINITY_DN103769_c0_g1_i1:26-361(+)
MGLQVSTCNGEATPSQRASAKAKSGRVRKGKSPGSHLRNPASRSLALTPSASPDANVSCELMDAFMVSDGFGRDKRNPVGDRPSLVRVLKHPMREAKQLDAWNQLGMAVVA